MRERTRTEQDRVLSCSTAGELLGLSRQAVHKAVNDGRIPGFRDPEERRVWVQREWVELNAPGGLRLLARIEALEAAAAGGSGEVAPVPQRAEPIADLERQLADAQAENTMLRTENVALSSENVMLRVDNATTKEQNLLLLAAAEDQDEADKLLDEAHAFEESARRARRRAATAARRASRKYRDAVSQNQLPKSPGDLPT